MNTINRLPFRKICKEFIRNQRCHQFSGDFNELHISLPKKEKQRLYILREMGVKQFLVEHFHNFCILMICICLLMGERNTQTHILFILNFDNNKILNTRYSFTPQHLISSIQINFLHLFHSVN